MKIVVLDRLTLGDDLDISAAKAFGEMICYDKTDPDEVESHIGDADVVFVNKVKLNRDNLKNADNLKVICEAATGYDNIDTAFCREKGIAVANVKGYSTHSVAQVTLSMALSLATNLADFRALVASGNYTEVGIANRLEPVFCELYGKTWGIVGAGNIGRQVAAVARAMGCHVIGFSRTPKENIEQVGIDELCRRADVISVHLPLSDETRGIIGESEIALMKKNAILVNVARGAVTDERALAEAVLAKRIGGLGVDVYSVEPFGTDHPFYAIKDHPRVIFTPHMAWGAKEARARCISEVAENIRSFQSGGDRNRID